MDLQPGCPLVLAPHFHLAINWAERIQLGTVAEEDGAFLPGRSWRAPTVDEQRLLVGDPLLLTQDEARAQGLCLLVLPRHLQAIFWRMLEEAQAAQAPSLEGFDRFVAEIARFLNFKGLLVPADAIFDLVVSKPDQPSIQWDAETDRPIGLTFNLAPWVAWPLNQEERSPRLWGGFNLGAEAVQILFMNLPAARLAEEAARLCPDDPPPATLDDLARRFLTCCPNYPLVRLRLEPGEGYRVPLGGILIDACTLETEGPGMMLMVRAGGGS